MSSVLHKNKHLFCYVLLGIVGFILVVHMFRMKRQESSGSCGCSMPAKEGYVTPALRSMTKEGIHYKPVGPVKQGFVPPPQQQPQSMQSQMGSMMGSPVAKTMSMASPFINYGQ